MKVKNPLHSKKVTIRCVLWSGGANGSQIFLMIREVPSPSIQTGEALC